MAENAKKRATYADIEAAPQDVVAEIIDGELFTHPRPFVRHAATAVSLAGELTGPYQKGRGGPGGWVFAIEPELHLDDQILVPDLAGWRREAAARIDLDTHIKVAPDWVCEILSASTEARDRSVKSNIYAAAGVGHMWLVDPRLQLLQAMERVDGRWLLLGSWRSDDEARVAPFEAILISLADLWPLDKPLGLHESPQALYAGDR